MSYMFVRPPTVRTTRNAPRRAPSIRTSIGEVSRPLLRQFIRNRQPNSRKEAYLLEVREGPAINGNTNAASGKSIPQLWVTVRERNKAQNAIGLPVSICDTILKHLLTCVVTEEEEEHPLESSEESDLACGSPNVATDTQTPSPTRASGDGKSPTEEATSEDASVAKKTPLVTQHRTFQLNRLKPIRIVCDATGCTLEVIARDPMAKKTTNGTEESGQVVTVDPTRRWIVSAPLETRPNVSSNGEQGLDSNGIVSSASGGGRRKHPWEARGAIELHEDLMAQLSAFLADVVTRYRTTKIPDVRSLYSASGSRRFFFDLRDTRWGKRLHISQVTDLHRNVIGIPLEALVSFRSRLDMVIESLGLEDQHNLRSIIYRKNRETISPRGSRRTKSSPGDASNEAEDSGDGESSIRKDVNHRSDQAVDGNRSRSREHRRQRAPGAKGNENTDMYVVEGGSRRNGPGKRGYWNNARDRPIQRRTRNLQPFNRNRKTSTEVAESDTNSKLTVSAVVPVTESVIDGPRVQPTAESTA